MANEGDGKNDVKSLSYLLDEYKYRHDLCWRVVFRLTSVVALLSVIPYINNKLTGQLPCLILIPPFLATCLARFGFVVMRNELILFHGIAKSYHYLQNRFFACEIKEIAEEVKHTELQDKRVNEYFFSDFDIFVWIYLSVLFVLSFGNFFFPLARVDSQSVASERPLSLVVILTSF